jgi:hypothetical protein
MAYARTEDRLAGKGVKKPVHSTVEERKQRNRQAQAAFRERRTEYIKELEELVGIQKADLQRSQAAHSQATDECLMLRYKNSLLERILLEKGIDVQAELYARRDTSIIDPIQGVATVRRNPISTARPKDRQNNSKAPQPTPRVTASPPSLVSSPQSLTTESNVSPRTPTSVLAPEFGSAIVRAPEFQAHLTTGYSNQKPISTEVHSPPNKAGAQLAAEGIVKRLNRSKTGSMRDAAAYYLSSFLEHIDNLGKYSFFLNPSPFSRTFLVLD